MDILKIKHTVHQKLMTEIKKNIAGRKKITELG